MRHLVKSVLSFRQLTVAIIIIVFFNTFFNVIFAQEKSKPTRQSSLEAYSNGDYEEAYKQFSELLQLYPKDPVYKYYSGVTLVKLKRDPEKAATLLEQALHSSSVMKSLPGDALFYLGRAQQLAGNYADAIDTYNKYTSQAGKKAARERDVPNFIQECKVGHGQIAGGQRLEEKVIEAKPDTTVKVFEKVEPELARPADIHVTSTQVPVEKSEILDDGLDFQYKSDSLTALAGRLKNEYTRLQGAEQAAMKARISEAERLAALYQLEADKKYAAATGSQLTANQPAPEVPGVETESKTLIPDTVPVQVAPQDPQPVPIPDEKSEIAGVVNIPVISQQANTYEFFEVLPKPETGTANSIEIDPEIPAGLIYRIQIGVFRNPVTPAFFKGITPIYGFRTSTGATIYYAGMFRRSADAKKALTEVKAKGFKDSFIVSLFNGKSVSSDRAAVLEKEWGIKPFFSVADTRVETSTDTVPPSLIFRVEAARTIKPLKDEEVEKLRGAAGNRGLDIQTLDDGNIVYLIGKFITFTSATEFADLLVRNGYREAKVVAWLGKKQIPVETARQLFENP